MTPLTIGLVGLGVILLGILAVILGMRSASTGEMDERMREFVIEPAAVQQRWPYDTLAIRRPELRGSFASRILRPFFNSIGRFLGRFTPASTVESVNKSLVAAGNPMNLGAREFYAIRLVFMLLGALMGYAFYTRMPERFALLMGLIVFVVFAYAPTVWLRGRIRRRRDRIKRSMPDALDMLSVCADAGLGFDQSLQRVGESWKTELGREFTRVVKEMSLGVSRAAALRGMAERLNVTELSSFVAIILQSDELGMSIADTLHSQANQMRIERRYWAQEQARKLPIKMLFPLMFLILPALFVVVLGPAIPSLANLLGGLGP